MTYLYVINHIAYTFLIITFMLSTLLMFSQGIKQRLSESDFTFRKWAWRVLGQALL